MQRYVEVIGSTEIRTTVAVKEVPKTGSREERQAVRELLLLKKKLKGGHPNIIKLFDVKSTGSIFYIIMQYCSFSLDQQPQNFQQFLHGVGPEETDSLSPADIQRQCDVTGTVVLNALVQDLLRAIGFLHASHIMHCDIKVC